MSWGRVQPALGRREQALDSYLRGQATVEAIRGSVPANELARASFTGARRDLFVEPLDLLVDMNRPAEALAIAERYHARAFLDVLAEARIDPKDGGTGADRDREDVLTKRISQIQSQLWEPQLSGEARKTLGDELARVELESQDLYVEIRRTNPRYADVRYPRPVTPDRIQSELLDPETVLIEYVLGTKRSLAWVVSNRDLVVRVLPPREEIERRVIRYRATLSERAESE